MADITRPLLNQIKRNIRESEYFLVVTLKGADFKINSNLNTDGQLRFMADVGERLLAERNRYLTKEKANDNEEGTTPESPDLLVGERDASSGEGAG